MGWDWNDVEALSVPARQQIIAQLEQRIARGGDPAVVRQWGAQVRQLRQSITRTQPPAAEPDSGPRRAAKAATVVPRRVTDIGDLYEPSTCAYQTPSRIVVQILATVELTNQHSGRHMMVTHAVEARWTAEVERVCNEWAITPEPGPVTLTVWHLRDRARARGHAPDWDSARYPLKGAVDGLVRAGVIRDDGPGYLRGAHLVEAVLSNVEGLILVLEPASPLPPFPRIPILTVPHHP